MQLTRAWLPAIVAVLALLGAWLAGVELDVHGEFLAPLLFGNSSPASKNSSTSSADTTTYNTDKRQVVDTGSVGVSSDSSTVNVTSTDHDAIKRSFDLATVSSTNNLESINAAVKFASDTLRIAGDATKAASTGVASAYQTAQDSASGMRFLVAAGAVIALVIGVSQFKKKAA